MANKLFTLGSASINVLALSLSNVRRLQEITNNKVICGVMAKDFVDDGQLLSFVEELKENEAIISLGLGGGDSAQAVRVVELSSQCDPAHVNQVFPLASYTQSLLVSQGKDGLVNALVAPGFTDETVILSTGPKSGELKPVEADCITAAAMIAEMNIKAVKFFPLNNRLENMVNLVSSCSKAGIPIFEPTGGINVRSVGEIVRRCLRAGAEIVIPHVYTSLVKDGRTDYSAFTEVWETLKKL
jgi:2-dehydro-3-deoxy-phosphogluconate aldolase